MLPASFPGSFSRGQHIGIDVVLPHDALFVFHIAVVPYGSDLAGNLLIALLCVVDIAFVDANEVGKHIEMVHVVIAAIDVGQSGDAFSCRAPHLCHVGPCLVGNAHATDGIPNHHALPFFVDMVGDDTQEIGVGDGLFIGSDMDVGRIDEDFSHLVENVFQLFHSLCRLHGMPHGAGESCAVSWHVDFGNHRDAVF